MRRIISLLLVLYLCLYVSGQNRDGVKYVFPFHPGSVEWKKLGTDSARILALQMPQNVLQKMPTESLLEACLDFPYTYDMFAFNNFDMGFEVVKKRFNGFDELLKRNDITNVLLDKYEMLFHEDKLVKSREGIFEMIPFRIYLIAYLTGLDDVVMNMNELQLERLATVTESHLKLMEENIKNGESMILRVIKKNQSILRQIQTQQDYSEGSIFYGEGGVNRRIKLKYTPNGSSVISGELISSDLSDSLKRGYRYLAEVIHGGTYVSDATLQYNCHAFAWHMSEEHPDDSVWIGLGSNTHENIYWEDGSYIEVPEAIATIISYEEVSADHSAVRYDSLMIYFQMGTWLSCHTYSQ